MGLRVRKSIKVAPGVKLNVGKKSVGVSVGGKHGGVSVNSKSGVNTRISVPGTGVSYTQHVSNKNHPSSGKSSKQNSSVVSPGAFLFIGSILIIIGVATISVGSFVNEVTGGGPILWCIGGFCILLGIIMHCRELTSRQCFFFI